MIAIIGTFLLFGWIAIAMTLGRALSDSLGLKDFGTFVLTAVLVCIPFTEEIYKRVSFQAHCVLFAGTRSLSPVQASRVLVRRDVWQPTRVLQHPGVSHIKARLHANGQLEEEPTWLSISRIPSVCDQQNNKAWRVKMQDDRSRGRKRLPTIERDGYCLDRSDPMESPQVTLTGKDMRHDSYSLLFPYAVSESIYQVRDNETRKVLSEFSRISTNPGWLIRQLPTGFSRIKCPNPLGVDWRGTFPYNSDIYEFLQRAIKEDDND